MSKRALVAIADGTEELEAVTVIDTLRRAEIEVTVASVSTLQITASRQVKIIADKLISDCKNDSFDTIILPGGMPGAQHLRDSKDLLEILKKHDSKGALIAAICASPAVVLAYHGFLINRKATSYPSFHKDLPKQEAVHERTVLDGHFLTSQGPGTALEFSLFIVEILLGKALSEIIKKGMIATNDH